MQNSNLIASYLKQSRFMTSRTEFTAERLLCLALRPVLVVLLLLAALPARSADVSLLVPDDVVRITVYGNADLTTVARIAANGRITFPLIGDINIGGVSTTEAEKSISRMLDQGGFVRNAQVSIFVEERSEVLGPSVTILGQVKTSGRFPLRDGSDAGVETLIDLLALAGGVSPDAADYLYLIRQSGATPERIRVDLVNLLRSGDIKANVALLDGDILLIPEMDVFYIYGEVSKPGRYRLERDMTVMQALAVASGVSDTGSDKGIVLNRQGSQGMQSLESSLTDRLQPDDVIYVKERFF